MKSVSFFLIMILLSASTIFVQQSAGAGSYTFTDIYYPGAKWTWPNGINDSGQVVGYYYDGNNDHGFIYTGGTLSPLDYPGATETELWGISNNGQIVGQWDDSSGGGTFVRSSDGKFITIYPPGTPNGINNSGKVVGWYSDQAGHHGFVYSGGGYATIDYPGADSTGARGINDSNEVVGSWGKMFEPSHGFVLTGSNFTSIDYPNALATDAYGINNKGQVAGIYIDTPNHCRGFVYSGGSFIPLDYPGSASLTWVNAINDNGDIVGAWCVDAECLTIHGFLASLSHSISGTVKKRNGTPVEDVTITLGGTSSDTTKTAFDGTYSFENLKSGPYTITPSKDKYTFEPKSINATITTDDLESQDFTLQTFTISGAVKSKKGEPADGVIMVLSGESSDTTQTASDGTYSFEDLGNGSYTVTPTPNTDWYYINPPFKNVSIKGKDVKNVNFTGKTPHNISGRILQDTTPVVGATLTLTNSETNQTAQATTDSEGNYEFDSILEGSYVVAPSMASFAFKPASKKVKLKDSDIADVDFSALALHSISGTVTVGGAPLQGATITLSGKSKATTTTGADGSYSFSNLLSGKYTVTPKMTGYTFTPAKIAVTITNMDVSGQNFEGKQI